MKEKYIAHKYLKQLKAICKKSSVNILVEKGKIYAEFTDDEGELVKKEIKDVKLEKIIRANKGVCKQSRNYTVMYGVFSTQRSTFSDEEKLKKIPKNFKEEMNKNNIEHLCLQTTVEIGDFETKISKYIKDDANPSKNEKVVYTEERDLFGKITSRKITTETAKRKQELEEKYSEDKVIENKHCTKIETFEKEITTSTVTTYNEVPLAKAIGSKILGLVSPKSKEKLTTKKNNEISKVEEVRIKKDKQTELTTKKATTMQVQKNGDTIKTLIVNKQIKDGTGNIRKDEKMKQIIRDVNGKILQYTKSIEPEYEGADAIETIFYNSKGEEIKPEPRNRKETYRYRASLYEGAGLEVVDRYKGKKKEKGQDNNTARRMIEKARNFNERFKKGLEEVGLEVKR